MNIFDKFFTKFAYKFDKGYPDMNNAQDVLLLESLISEVIGERYILNESFYELMSANKLEDEIVSKLNNGDFDGIDVEGVTFKSGKKYTPQSIDKTDDYTLNDLRKIVDEFDKPLFLTYTDNIKKLRSPFGVRIMGFDTPTKSSSIDFKRLIALNKLVKEYPEKIKIVSKMAAGLGYEEAQVDNFNSVINEVLKELDQSSLDLYINGKPQNIKISGALKRTGSGKADLALLDGDKEVYWISYKEGKYYKKDGSLAKIPFQQYGSLVTLYNQEYTEELESFNSYLKKLIPEFLDAIKANNEGVSVFKDVKFNPQYNNKSASDEEKSFINSKGDILPVSDTIKDFWKELSWDKFKTSIGTSTADVVIIEPKSSFYNAFIDDNNKESKILAGKAVYGLDFPSNENSSENCNILLQSDGKIEIEIITAEEDTPSGINLKIEGSSGHILFNPNLPYSPDDPGYDYTPALNMRHTKALSFIYDSSNTKTIFLSGRLLIYPLGLLKSSTEIPL
jgi:hypothetical protein